ncbi:MAG: hypothetical protein NTW19_21850 [Planctomycetota bacterium]|nr:hypothetical protein [Planctomycetota bacterium]
MYESLGQVTLKTGERVDAGVVHGPDRDWADRVGTLLGHKTPPWNWQNTQCLTREDLGLDASFYILHRGGIPFSNIMTIAIDGVGIFGHVFTQPDDRRKHATSLLMAKQMEHFRSRRGRTGGPGRALYLGTGYDSPAYHIYQSNGFKGLGPASGVMDWHASPRDAFEAEYFGRPDDPTNIDPIGWRHWPTSSPLFCADFGGRDGVVKLPIAQILGRSLTEEPVLRLLHAEGEFRRQEEPGRALALQNRRTGAVLGLACWAWDPIWQNVLVDVYCHPNHWPRAKELVAGLKLPTSAPRTLAHADAGCPGKLEALKQLGFAQAETLPGHVFADATKTGRVDVLVFERK